MALFPCRSAADLAGGLVHRGDWLLLPELDHCRSLIVPAVGFRVQLYKGPDPKPQRLKASTPQSLKTPTPQHLKPRSSLSPRGPRRCLGSGSGLRCRVQARDPQPRNPQTRNPRPSFVTQPSSCLVPPFRSRLHGGLRRSAPLFSWT